MKMVKTKQAAELDYLADHVANFLKPNERPRFVRLVAMTKAYGIPDHKVKLALSASSDIEGLDRRLRSADEVIHNGNVVPTTVELRGREAVLFFYCGHLVAQLDSLTQSARLEAPFRLQLKDTRGSSFYPEDTSEIVVSFEVAIRRVCQHFGLVMDPSLRLTAERVARPADKKVAIGREVVYDFEET